jgi:hypothetical protein
MPMSWSMSRDGIAELNDVMKKHGLNAPLIAIEATGRLHRPCVAELEHRHPASE